MSFLMEGFSTVWRVYEAEGGPQIIPYMRMREVQIPSITTGAPIDTTTMLNEEVVTKAGQHLFDYGDMVSQCNYDIRCYVVLAQQIMRHNRVYYVELPDGGGFSFYGQMYEFTPAPLRRGEFVLGEAKVCLLNRIGTTGVETSPNTFSPNIGSLVWPPNPRPVGLRA